MEKILIPLSHIKLSVEMLESIIDDNDMKLYLEVIARNSARINNLIDQLLENKQPDNIQIKIFNNNQQLHKVCLK